MSYIISIWLFDFYCDFGFDLPCSRKSIMQYTSDSFHFLSWYAVESAVSHKVQKVVETFIERHAGNTSTWLAQL